MTTWFRRLRVRLGTRLGSLATEDPDPEYSSMDARDGLGRHLPAPPGPHRRLAAVPAAGEPGRAPARQPSGGGSA